MAKKSRRRPRRARSSRPSEKSPGDGPDDGRSPSRQCLPDPRTLEGLMQALLVGGLSGSAGRRPWARPRRSCPGLRGARRQRRELAKDALAVSPDCADAYVLLAEHAREPQGGPAPVRARRWPPASGRWGRTPSSGMSATSGASSKPGPTCVPGWAWPMPSGPRAGVTRPSALAGHAPAEPRRQPGRPLHPGRLPALPRPGRRPGPAPPAVPRRRLGCLGLHQGPARLPPARRHARSPPVAQGGQEDEQARPGLPAGREVAAARAARLLQPRRSASRSIA